MYWEEVVPVSRRSLSRRSSSRPQEYPQVFGLGLTPLMRFQSRLYQVKAAPHLLRKCTQIKTRATRKVQMLSITLRNGQPLYALFNTHTQIPDSVWAYRLSAKLCIPQVVLLINEVQPTNGMRKLELKQASVLHLKLP